MRVINLIKIPGQKRSVTGLTGLLLLMLLLAACSGGQTEEVATPAAEAATEEVAPTPTNESVEPTTAAPEPTAQIQASGPAVCEPVEVSENPFIAEVSAAEWVKGPANAPVTLIEYGDFQ